MTRTAVIAGYTGLVGKHLLAQLLHDPRYASIVAVGRREPVAKDARLKWVKSDLTDLNKIGGQLAADDAFCGLGTTLRAAGSKAAFEAVDYHMVVNFARAAHAAGARRMFLVSALSASPKSPIYYSRIKGRAEQALRDEAFDTLHIVQPSLLIGARTESRPGEGVAQRLAPVFNLLMQGPLKKYRAIRAEDVAGALVELSRREDRGVFVHTLPLPR